MSISVRLSQDIENALRQKLRQEGIPLSEFVRQAIIEKLENFSTETDPYTLGKSVFGRHQSGDTDRSQQRKSIVKSRLHEKYRR